METYKKMLKDKPIHLVKEATKVCKGMEEDWDTMYSGHRYAMIWCWIVGYEAKKVK